MDSAITFLALTEPDLPLLHTWLSRPHVTAWWEPAPTAEQVREDYPGSDERTGDRLLPQGGLPGRR